MVRKMKMKTFAIWQTAESRIEGDILDRFKQHQNELKHHIEVSDDLLKRKSVMASPSGKNIVYTLETGFDLITTHERSHLEQAKEVLALLKE